MFVYHVGQPDVRLFVLTGQIAAVVLVTDMRLQAPYANDLRKQVTCQHEVAIALDG